MTIRGKATIERTFLSINTLFCQHVAGYTGRDVTRRGSDIGSQELWSLADLQELLDEWVIHCFSGRLKINLYCDLLFHVADMSATCREGGAAAVCTATARRPGVLAPHPPVAPFRRCARR